MTGLEWARPWGLVALALPPLLLLLARVRRRPPELATGTLALWREVLAERAGRGGGRTRLPPSAWLLALALLLGAVALAGPRRETPELARTWTVLVDRSSSMHLAHSGGATRLERALAAAVDWLAPRLAPGDEVRWAEAVGPEGAQRLRTRTAASAEPPADLTRRRGGTDGEPAPEPRWPRHDRPGWLWVTDGAPDPLPEHAGVFASGGPARPGPVATLGADRVDWDGERLVVVPGGAPPRSVLVADLPEVLAAVVAAWAEERGLAAAGTAGLGLALAVRGPEGAAPPDAERPAAAARDGRSLRGTARRLQAVAPDGPEAEVWLADADGAPLVRARPGLVECAWSALAPPAGDPAAFAVSWSELLDRCLLPAPGVVPLAERLAAGEPLARGASEPPAAPRGPDAERVRPALRGPPLDAWLALAAALAALAGLVYSGSDSSSPTAP